MTDNPFSLDTWRTTPDEDGDYASVRAVSLPRYVTYLEINVGEPEDGGAANASAYLTLDDAKTLISRIQAHIEEHEKRQKRAELDEWARALFGGFGGTAHNWTTPYEGLGYTSKLIVDRAIALHHEKGENA